MAATDTAPIESSIIVVREQRVILAADLASIYGVETRALNQAVKRNIEKFPHDFMFRLTRTEVQEISPSRSQSVILKRGQKRQVSTLCVHGTWRDHGSQRTQQCSRGADECLRCESLCQVEAK